MQFKEQSCFRYCCLLSFISLFTGIKYCVTAIWFYYHHQFSSDKCVCSCHKEIEHLKSEIFSIKTFFKKEIENLKVVFSSSNNEESSSIKFVNDRLVQHLSEENKTKNDIIKILAGNFSVNVNKPQSTDFSLQWPQNAITNSATSIFSEEDINQFHQSQKNLLN